MLFRDATLADLPAIVRLLADDDFGAGREQPSNPLPPAYADAFAAMQRQGGNTLIVAEIEGDVAGCLQLIVMPGISHRGATRAEVEGVRVARHLRGGGVGAAMMAHAIGQARAAGCTSVQLTSNRARAGAHRFYERLGFAASHTGFKLSL